MRKPRTDQNEPDAFVERLRLAKGGCGTTLGELLDEFRSYLLLVANRELDDQLRAKFGPSDIVQDTLAHAHQTIGDFRGCSPAELRAWLERALCNHCHNIRVAFTCTGKRDLGREVPLGGAGVTDVAAPTSRPNSPSALAIANEEARRVDDLMQLLSPEEFQVVRWHTWDSLGFEEISRRLKRSPDAVRRLWLRAIQRLKREWEAEDAKRSDAP